MHEIPVWKKEEVERLTDLLKTSPVVAVVDIEGIPAFQFQQIRSRLRGTIDLTVSRNTLIERALDKVVDDREGIDQIKEHLSGQTALVYTDINPFKLFNRMEATKTNAPASGGEVAPENIKVQKGNTPFKPGPVVGELQKVGIPASIQSGKVIINKTKVVVKKGDVINSDLAKMLTRLDINPVIVGLNLRVVYENGTIYYKDVLDVDPEEYLSDIKRSIHDALSLSVNAAYPTRETIRILLSKASKDAFSLAMNSDMIVKETIKLKLSEAHMKMLSLSKKLDHKALDKDILKALNIEEEIEKDEVEDENDEKQPEKDINDQ